MTLKNAEIVRRWVSGTDAILNQGSCHKEARHSKSRVDATLSIGFTMAITTRPKISPANVIELHWENREGHVRVVPKDKSLLAMPVEVAIEACRAFKQQIVFKDQFDMLLNRLAEWIEAHQAKLEQAFLTTRDSGLLFLVVLNQKQLDWDVEKDLTELDLEIAHDDDFDLIDLSVHAIPQSSQATLASFVSRKMSLRYALHGERE